MSTATRKLTITALKEITTGTGKRGAWTLYAASVTDADGQSIDAKFKTFESLPLRELIEVEVERQEHEQHGVSYLLKRPRQNGNGLQVRVEALEQRVAALEQT